MNRVRALLIRSSRTIVRPARGAADWLRARFQTPVVTLDSVRRRLGLLLAAMYESQFEIVAVTPASSAATAHGHSADIVTAPDKAADGPVIKLPATIDAADGSDSAIARYRLLAIEQAARIMRGSAAFAPGRTEPVARDLYNLCESAAIDASIAHAAPGVVGLLMTERARALAERPPLDRLSAREREVERRVVAVLGSEPGSSVVATGAGSSPADSLAWAREVAESLSGLGGEYRSRPGVSVWGPTLENAVPGATDPDNALSAMMFNSPGTGAGTNTAPAPGGSDALQELSSSGTDAAKSPAPESDDAGDNDGQEPPEHGVPVISRTPLAADGVAAAPRAGAGPLGDGDTVARTVSRSGGGIVYPEWDCNTSEYREIGTVVRIGPAAQGDIVWAERVLGEHPALVRRVRREFERLKARRLRMPRQREGEELDLAACITALADAAAGDSSDDRLYLAVRAARRAIAITVLVDVSGSTDDLVSDGRRVIDVEKTTLLLASEAFDALGDSYSIITFESSGAADVRIAAVKEFAERNGEAVRRRIAGMEPGGNTRLGAAIRHATALLSAQHVRHRLLLILSDGKPSDVDRYFTTYAVEDSRRAVLEARSAGLYPFCLTIDASDPDPYLGRIFGAAGYAILRRPEQLPVALLDLVRQLLRGGASG